VKIERGQFLCSAYDGCNVSVRFDARQVERFHASGPSTHETTVLFVTPADRFLRSLRAAKTVSIEAEFFQEGSNAMTFDTTGLKW
jgi:invasion protein IalB